MDRPAVDTKSRLERHIKKHVRNLNTVPCISRKGLPTVDTNRQQRPTKFMSEMKTTVLCILIRLVPGTALQSSPKQKVRSTTNKFRAFEEGLTSCGRFDEVVTEKISASVIVQVHPEKGLTQS